MSKDEQYAVVGRLMIENKEAASRAACYRAQAEKAARDLMSAAKLIAKAVDISLDEVPWWEGKVEDIDYPKPQDASHLVQSYRSQRGIAESRKKQLDEAL